MMALCPRPLAMDKNLNSHMAMSVGLLTQSAANATTAGQLRPISTSSSSVPRRPKLSVNTLDLPSAFSNKSTSLRLETLSVTSPTSRNTFSNSYGHPPTPVSRKPRLTIDSSLPALDSKPLFSTPVTTSPLVHSQSQSTASTPSVDSITSATLTEEPVQTPYRLSFNLPSILRNGPIPYKRRRTSPSTPRPMFPSIKRVAFRPQLTEEIQTTTYTLKHSDIDTGLPSPSLPAPQAAEAAPLLSKLDDEDDTVETHQLMVTQLRSPRTGEKRDSSSDEDDGDDNVMFPKTPIAGRRKRMREWTWTLGPLNGSESQESI